LKLLLARLYTLASFYVSLTGEDFIPGGGKCSAAHARAAELDEDQV